jgi:hypothetical protein
MGCKCSHCCKSAIALLCGLALICEGSANRHWTTWGQPQPHTHESQGPQEVVSPLALPSASGARVLPDGVFHYSQWVSRLEPSLDGSS